MLKYTAKFHIKICLTFLALSVYAITGNAQSGKQFRLSNPDKSLSILLDCQSGCLIREVLIKGKNVLSDEGAYTGIEMPDKIAYTSAKLTQLPKITRMPKGFRITEIVYGPKDFPVEETWDFTNAGTSVIWEIKREYKAAGRLKSNEIPVWNFSELANWKGGILDNGGVVWWKYLKEINDTYGVHTGGVTFWNNESGDAFKIAADAIGDSKFLASKFSRKSDQTISFIQILSKTEMQQNHNLSRFVHKKNDIFKASDVKKGIVKIKLRLDAVNYFKTYSRGNLVGIDSASVRELLNTTGRYGVVDNNIVGGNGWLTNWKCLHEPFFAQIGLALNDPNYQNNMANTLDRERDLAMLDDGRVLSRWHDIPGDEAKGTYNPETGYYETIWGYTIDSQTGYVINASEQFDLSGDLNWLKRHKTSCEKALDWLIRRDKNKNGIFEMLNNSIEEKKASDWLDIVWASYENAFVNAQMYDALRKWADCERVMGDDTKAAYYAGVAEKLKSAFNKPIEDGGFWSEQKRQYVYWRDKDGRIHGDNLVTPVNFAAIGYGICGDQERIGKILKQIEDRTSNEGLFHWPLCFDSFKKEEVQAGNWPFPRYENGDIFPTWGYLGIRSYVKYDRQIALKYINKLLEQYKKDGLSSQRYSRSTQLGLGDDILAGICTSITALYRDIYGVRPKWNRMGLEPNMVPELNGTSFNYWLRGENYKIFLNTGNYTLKTNHFTIRSNEAFGANQLKGNLNYYRQNKEKLIISAGSINKRPLTLELNWKGDTLKARISGAGPFDLTFNALEANKVYRLTIAGSPKTLKTDASGRILLNLKGTTDVHISDIPRG